MSDLLRAAARLIRAKPDPLSNQKSEISIQYSALIR
jgi:hypothetical protein